MIAKASPPLRTFAVLAIDVAMTAAALVITYVLLHGVEHVALLRFRVAALIMSALALVVYPSFGVYRNLWRYVSIVDLALLAQAATFVLAVFYVSWAVFGLPKLSPASTYPIIHWMVLIFCLSGPRLVRRMIADPDLLRRVFGGSVTKSRTILLVCSPAEAELFIRAQSLSAANTAFEVIGIVDSTASAVGRSIHGVKILGTPENLAAILEGMKHRPSRLGVANDAFKTLPADFEALCATYGLSLGQLPSPSDVQDREDAGRLLKPIAIEDVLGRSQRVVDLSPVREVLSDSVVLVTGAGGSIGSELVRQIASLNPRKLVLVEQSEYGLYDIDREAGEKFPNVNRVSLLGDVRDEAGMDAIFAAHKPDFVYHAAALKHVPIVEAQPHEGVLTNVLGTKITGEAAARHGARAFVLISTDKAVAPLSAMGASKRMAEMVVQHLDRAGHATRFMSVRFGNVLGSSGSVVPLFRHQIARGGPVTVTHPDMTRFFMTIREAVGLVLQASAQGVESVTRGFIYVLDMGRPVRILDVAHQMIRLAGLEPDKDIKVEIVGLRPGEKLHEALFCEAETPSDTSLGSVMAARGLDESPDLGPLLDAALRQDQGRVLRLLGEMIPDAQINA